MKCIFQQALFLTAVLLSACSAGKLDYARSIEGIARGIEELKGEYPQLEDFSAAENLKAEEYKISYGYHTHEPEGRGGWASAVPNPDDDGVWFYIDFHSPDSTAQIHTQPAGFPYCIGGMKLSFLSLEGAKTKPLAGAIWEILRKHGVVKCEF
ncbi:MAG: hypothetical protein FJ088_01780 [Deltaproteobacteria bacterium]|nr:hypothetical protein [Deltaproteobacteria bacterium]